MNIREYILSQKLPSAEDLEKIVKHYAILTELDLMVSEGLMDEADATLSAIIFLLRENTQLQIEIFNRKTEDNKHGRQIAKFTGFK